MSQIKKYTFLFFFFILLFSSASFASEQPGQVQFGYVNVADAVLLHPFMKEFDATPRRFKLSALKDDQGKLKARNLEKIKTELQEVLKEQNTLEKARIKTEKEYTESIQKLSSRKFSSGTTGELELQKYNEERAQIDIKYTKLLEENRNAMKKNQAKTAELNQESAYVSHASHEETNKVFGLILDDVYEATDAVAKFYKIPFVFNSSFEFSRTNNNLTISNPMPEFFAGLDKKLSNEDEGELTMAAGIINWLELKNNNLMNCSDARLARFVLKGGVNMTPAVVDYIYQKHEVSKSHRDFMQDFFKKVSTDK